MRRHEKASTAGSTKRQAKGLGRFFRGADAGRGSSLTSKGIGVPSARRLVLPVGVFASLIALMIFALPAGASKTHLFKETFGSAAQPSFGSARGIAVDQSTGDVLVMDAGGTPSIKRYNPDGTAANFSALGTNTIDGQGTGDETPQNGLSFAGASESQIAVDNSGTATDGNIYVTQSSPKAINIFASTGAYLGQLTESSGGAFSEACGVAVDPSGAVYVGDFGGGIHKFVPAANPPVNADNSANFTTVAQPCTLAAGSGATAGFLFAAEYNGPIVKLDNSTGEVKYEVSSGSNTTVSVDPGTGHVYAATSNSIRELDASGAGSATSVSSFELSSQLRGVAVRSSSGDIYVSRSGAAEVEVFEAALAAIPEVESAAATGIAGTTATLNGTVNPDGEAVTECIFEWGTTTGYGETAPCVPNAAGIGTGTSPVAVHADIGGLDLGTVYHFRLKATNANPNGTTLGDDESLRTLGPGIEATWSEDVVLTEAKLRAEINPGGSATTYHFEYGTSEAYGSETPELAVGSDSTVHRVTRFLTGLQPGTVYHYRLVATNADAVNESPDRTFVTYEPFVPDTSCANQAFRYGPSANLPDCRAYEMVSPLNKNGGDIRSLAVATGPKGFRAEINQAAVGGDKFTFSSYKPFANAVSGAYSNQYIASRGATGWSTEALSPLRAVRAGEITPADIDVVFKAFTDDLSQTWLEGYSRHPFTPTALPGPVTNIYIRNNTDGNLQAVTEGSPPPAPSGGGVGGFVDSSLDGKHVVFYSTIALTSDAPNDGTLKLYDYSSEGLRLASILPNDEAAESLGVEEGEATHGVVQMERTISSDGSRIFWANNRSGNGLIYVRIDGATTVQVSEGKSQQTFFWAANAEGSKALYGERIDLEPNLEKLYEFNVDTEARTLIASEVRGVAGTSEDLSHIYFVSKEDLAAGATAGERNFYLDREGTIVFIATLSAEDTAEAGGTDEMPNVSGHLPVQRPTRVSSDGRYLTFMSSQSLTVYDNTDAITGKADFEVYSYDAQTAQLVCISCNPSGARPVGKALVKPYRVKDNDTDFGVFKSGEPVEFWTAAWLPTWENSRYASRALAEDGSRIFFNSFDALVPQDTNGNQDVYEWEAHGTGTCQRPTGCIELISSGESSQFSEFLDASPSGNDVFIRTVSSLDPRDPGLWDVYDARVDGGYPPPPPPPPPCVGDACQGLTSPPGEESLASAAFRGHGNLSLRHACGEGAKAAAKLARQAKQLRLSASHSSSPARRRSLRRRSARLAKQAKRLSRSASRCRRANRGAKR